MMKLQQNQNLLDTEIMKKFKHKITGNIATETNSGKNFKVTEPKSFTVPKWIIENSKEWEEVVEKEYEIIQYYCKSTPSDDGEQIHYSEEIKTVLRLSDGEVFTLKDKVKDPTGQTFTITRFYLDAYDNHLLAKDEAGRGHISITKIEKVKYPLFTTEDGVDIFKGDKYFQISNEFKWAECTTYDESNFGEELIIFSTKEASEKYIEENKPQYSKKDMIEFAQHAQSYCSYQTVTEAFDFWKPKS